MTTSSGDEVLVRALGVLEALAGMDQPASLQAIAERTALPKSKAYRALRSLQDQGFIDRLGRQGYRLGGRSLALSMLLRPRAALVAAARPIMQRLSDQVGETVTVHLRSGYKRVLFLGATPRTRQAYALPAVGERAPIHTGCSGLAILAFLPTQERTDLAQGVSARRWPTPVVLAAIRTDGYALSFSGNHIGANGVAAPILDPVGGLPLGSVAVAGGEARLPEARLRELAAPLRKACDRLAPHFTAALGVDPAHRLTALDIAIKDNTGRLAR